MTDTPRFIDDSLLRVGTIDFQCDFAVDDAPDGRLPVMKERSLVERYIELCEDLRPKVIVELGIRRGGSTALLNELNHPDTLIALELSAEPAPVLCDYVDQRGLADVVRTFYGVDQSDRARLSEILAQELGDRPIDLVIDDASHLYRETLSSFETLFPHLRAGALFVIEDWNGDHLISDAIARTLEDATAPDHDAIEERVRAERDAQADDLGPRMTSLTQLAVELVVARASTGDAVRSVSVNGNWIVVERGADALDPPTFRLSDHVNDHFGFVPASSRAGLNP